MKSKSKDKIILLLGLIYSGKTTKIFNMIKQLQYANKEIILVRFRKSKIDYFHYPMISTHKIYTNNTNAFTLTEK